MIQSEMRRGVLALAVTVTALAGGCMSPGDMTPKPEQARALDIIWRQVYGQTNSPPEVEWHHDTALFGDTKGFTCAGWKVLITDDEQGPETFHFSNTPLAHELMHERTFERTHGDVDAGHLRGDWDLEGVANYWLQQNGL